MPPPPPTVGAPSTSCPFRPRRRKAPGALFFGGGCGPPNRPQSSGPSSQGRGISWPLPEACRALAGGEKDTLHCPADPRTPANVRQEVRRPPLQRPFVFLGASDLHPLTAFHPGAGPPAPCRLFLPSADVLGPSECAEGPSHLGEAGVALCSRTGGLWLLLPTHVAARRPRCCPSRVIGRTAAPTAAGLTGESEMRK